jgi:hypothetical protein
VCTEFARLAASYTIRSRSFVAIQSFQSIRMAEMSRVKRLREARARVSLIHSVTARGRARFSCARWKGCAADGRIYFPSKISFKHSMKQLKGSMSRNEKNSPISREGHDINIFFGAPFGLILKFSKGLILNFSVLHLATCACIIALARLNLATAVRAVCVKASLIRTGRGEGHGERSGY